MSRILTAFSQRLRLPCLAMLGVACTGTTGEKATYTSPCAGEDWGILEDPESAVHVRVDGDDDGDGSLSAPVATLDAAVALTRAAEEASRVIFIGPGTYTSFLTSLESAPTAGGSDDGLVVSACADEVTLEPANEKWVVRVSEAQDVVLDGLKLTAGNRALWIRSGARVNASRINIDHSKRAGVLIDGHDTLVDFDDLSISETEDEPDGDGRAVGYGLAIAQSTVTWRGGRISGSRSVGIFINGGGASEITLEDITVEDTAADANGTLGRAVHAQQTASLSMNSCSLTGSSDAGLFVMQSYDTTINDTAIKDVAAGSLDDGSSSGDGAVFTSLDDSGLVYDPALFPVTFDDGQIADAARAAVLVEGVSATLNGTAATDSGLGIVVQTDGTVEGEDGDLAVELDEDELLELNREILGASFLLEE